MSTDDALGAMRAKLASLEAENAARSGLLDRSRAEAVAESKEKLDKQARVQGEVFVRLQERNRRAKAAGGWATESTVGDRDHGEMEFGFDDESAGDPEADRTANRPAPPAAGRPRRRAEHDDESFADTDWLAT
ncbi:hypothetical protein [Amycolatopsis jiangsuensis]|uniref:Uncharacterized protein n=1 Tax=Amycolatopsis jiangsuensis TaxID=1181879 RepID=A0A840IYQ0_9PSEU|nr:hypothetical protein [Amycolatopsis jiangsuensis]MBB4686417.1 hypothetical protein [Amycolatopsis jiangsuensis]